MDEEIKEAIRALLPTMMQFADDMIDEPEFEETGRCWKLVHDYLKGQIDGM